MGALGQRWLGQIAIYRLGTEAILEGGVEMQVMQEGAIRVARRHDQADAGAVIAPATEDAADSAPFSLTAIGRTDFPKPLPSVWKNRLKLKENQNDRKVAGAP